MEDSAMSQRFLAPASGFCLLALRAGRPPFYPRHFLQKSAALARRVSSFPSRRGIRREDTGQIAKFFG
jgi:hypothetical protein